MSIQREELNNMKWGNVITGERLAPVHPGEILLHDFIEPMGLTRYKVAKFTSVPQRRIDEICTGKRAVTADTAMRLGRLFGMIRANLDEPANTVRLWKSQKTNWATRSTTRLCR